MKDKKEQKSQKVQKEQKEKKLQIRTEIWAIVALAIGVFLAVALHTEATGKIGNAVAGLLKGLFSSFAFVLPYCLIAFSILLILKKLEKISAHTPVFIFLLLLMGAIINSGRFLSGAEYAISFDFIKDSFLSGRLLEGGGALGMTLGLLLKKALGIYGLYILSIAGAIICVVLLLDKPLYELFHRDGMKKEKKADTKKQAEAKKTKRSLGAEEPENAKQMKIIDYMKDDNLFEGEQKTEGVGLEKPAVVLPGKGLNGGKQKISDEALKAEIEEIKVDSDVVPATYKMPSVELLKKVTGNLKPEDKGQLKVKALKLEETLSDFGVKAKVVQVTKGPAITRYEIQPQTGVKVSSIVRLADDIALNLEAKSIRMEAPIPGKAAVGIEVENERINLVSIREIIESTEFKSNASKITFALGKDIAGTPIVADLKTMPHLLIAGSTGSGKSVCLNSIIVSLLYKAKPDQVKLVLIDPKVVELGNYNGIPHLLVPVVTEAGKAAAALGWAVSEMTDRYKKFAEAGVRDLESYNKKIEKSQEEKPMPQIVIVIDELADLMMVAPAQVEESICRLAQMARAAGMHLIVATQRPSVDVITGVIKANIPARIAFAVSSQFDSRTILDMSGAEKLMGKGDMLFNPPGMAKPLRVQGCFISDGEVNKVIDYIKADAPLADYSEDIIQKIGYSQKNDASDDYDELLNEAIETVVRAEQASVSMLQRRFRIGYNRAARLVDMMEARGIIGASDGSRPRKVLISLDEYTRLLNDEEKE